MSRPRRDPEVSVVVATHNRAARLGALLEGLRAQTLEPGCFEVVVVDDASTDGTAELLARERERDDGPRLEVIRRTRNGGWAEAREEGWRVARAPLIAFTDDDCVPDPGWLDAGLRSAERDPESIVQGRTEPASWDADGVAPLARPFTHTIDVPEPDPHYQTCNVFYPRQMLERVGGFDVGGYTRARGEDADLAWRALESGATATFAPDAVVRHARNYLGPAGKLRRAASWDLRVYARHPGLRRAAFKRRWFWKGSHYLLVRALVAGLLPARLRAVRAWLATPYALHLAERGRVEGGGPLFAPYFLLCDLLELWAAVRSAVRYRTPML